MNEFYQATGVPADNARAVSSPMRSEFDAIENGCDKLPGVAGNNNRGVMVNSDADGLISVTPATYVSTIGTILSAAKDAIDGFVGKTLQKINFKNALGTITSFFSNSNASARTYTFPDQSGIVQLMETVAKGGRRNLIINGNFDIWQRGTSATNSPDYLCGDRWFLDMWVDDWGNWQEEFTLGQTDVPGNPRYYCHNEMDIGSGWFADSYAYRSQRIEDVRRFNGQQVVLTFYAKSDAAHDIAVEFVQHFGSYTGFSTVPSPDVTGIGVTTFNLTTSWQKFELKVALPSIDGKTLGDYDDTYLEVIFWMGAHSGLDDRTNALGLQGMHLDLARVQLEYGVVATDFAVRSISEELRLCQRYYFDGRVRFYGDVTNTMEYRGYLRFPVRMRGTNTNYGDNEWLSGTSLSQLKFPTTAVVSFTTMRMYGVTVKRTCNSTGTGYFRHRVYCQKEL